MKRKIVSGITLTFLLLNMLTLAFCIEIVESEPTDPVVIVAVDPVLSTADVGETFSVNITITGIGPHSAINGLFNWQFCIAFDANILHAVNVTEGPFLSSTGEETIFVGPTIDNSEGYVFAGATFAPIIPWPEEGATGNGTLATVTFKVVSSGVTQLHFAEDVRQLGTVPKGGLVLEIPSMKVDGTVICNHISVVDIIHPHMLNLRNKGKWITTLIELPEDYNLEDIDVSIIMLNDEVPAESSKVCGKKLMVKFDRAEVIALLSVGEATLTITGEVDGTPFEGSHTIRVISPTIHASMPYVCRGRKI